MTFWIAPIVIALGVAAVLLRALRPRGDAGMTPAASDMAVYRDQLKEVDRDLVRGVLSEPEAEAVRTEVSRRLLDADRRANEAAAASDGRLWPAAAMIVAIVIAGSFLLYSTLGAPGYADLPMAERLATLDAAARNRMSQDEAENRALPLLPQPPAPEPQFTELMERLRAALAERPGDVQGLSLLAQNEARLGNYAAARAAQERLVEAYGDSVPIEERLALLDLMVFTAGGFVSPEAERVLARILDDAPGNETALYYAGLLYSQTGRPDRAFPIWRRLLETSAPDAPWLPVIRAEIGQIAAAAGVDYAPPADTRGPTGEDIAAAEAMSPEDRQQMIRGMVEGLSDRLATDGGPPEDWARLITALGVLGEVDRARAIADEAQQVFADDADAIVTINAARDRLPQ